MAAIIDIINNSIISDLIQLKVESEKNIPDDFEAVRTKLLKHLKQTKDALFNLPEETFRIHNKPSILKSVVINDIIYILAVLCDEIVVALITSHNLSYKLWNNLDNDEFVTLEPGLRAVKFYQIFDEIGKGSIDLKKLFYICMSLGFRGEKTNNKELKEFKFDLTESLLDDPFKKNEIFLTPEAEQWVDEDRRGTICTHKNYKYIIYVLIIIIIITYFWLLYSSVDVIIDF